MDITVNRITLKLILYLPFPRSIRNVLAKEAEFVLYSVRVRSADNEQSLFFSWQSYSHITHSPEPRSPRRKIPYCNVVVCNRTGRDKNWTDYKRKKAECKQSTRSKTSATVDGREKNNFLIQMPDFFVFYLLF